MNDKERLKYIFDLIAKKREQYEDNPSFMSGTPGVMLFLAYYHQYSSDPKALSLLQSLYSSISWSDFESNIRYSDGLSGFFWVCVHIEKHFQLRLEVLDELNEFVSQIENRKAELANEASMDFLHGLLGLQLLFQDCGEEGLSKSIDQLVFREAKSSPNGTYWLESLGSEKDCINTSMAHGLAANINYLSSRIASYQGFKRDKIVQLIRSTVDFIKSIELSDEDSLFPSFIIEGEDSKSSRLAWCYGDLSIACALLYASSILNDNSIRTYAIQVAAKTVDRKSRKDSGVADLGFCHGSSGLIQMYSYFYRGTSLQIFSNASLFWKAFTEREFEKETNIYRAYRGPEEGWQESYGLLDGIAGVGLALISSTSSHLSSWEEAFYLKSIRDERNTVSPRGGGKASGQSVKV